MPNKPTHLTVGFVIGCLNLILVMMLTGISEKILAVTSSIVVSTTGLVLLSIIMISVSMSTSTLPDYLEPPTSKYHRSFFHSQVVLVLSAIMYVFGALVAIESNLVTMVGASLFMASVSGYLSHLILDYPLPRFIQKKPLHILHRW